MTLLSHNMPKQARWQGEYAANKILTDSIVAESFYNLASMRRSLGYIDSIFAGDEDQVIDLMKLPLAEIEGFCDELFP